ncbi:diphthine synthase [Mycoemilia scoparia]|uniref:diphthine methyl ester synthase n=1 Tax=Mycoemilia scoparia TaxID=417184 RepID=A0A9W7ZYJ4_9FUNG|nr:diphthine synthase [Mycoemilia scoparia]
MLYIIGLGLSDEYDITLKGLQAIKSCKREKLYEKEIVTADREMVEQESDVILKDADKENVAFLVVGDPYSGRKIYEPPRYMSVNQAVEQLLEVEEKRNGKVSGPEALAVGVARIGSDDQVIKAGTLQQLLTADFGKPLHSLVLVGKRLHEIEAQVLRDNAVDVVELNRVLARDFGIQF